MSYPDLAIDRWNEAAPALRDLFQSQMYGAMPPVSPLLLGEEKRLDARLRLRRMGEIEVLHAEPKEPAKATFVGVNFSGNHTVVDHPDVSEPRVWTYLEEVPRGDHRERWCVDDVTSAGFALATFCHSDVVPDDPALARPILDRMGKLGAVAAWAWGLLSVAATLSGPVIFVGHSRMGKAALVAGMFGGDGIVSIQSGCGGAAPSRTEIGETVGQITAMFPHWFTPAFTGYAGREEELPFDQQGLLALCAPKPLLLLNAEDDLWANPAGQEAMAELARPVYESFGVADAIGYQRRPGGHSVIREDWASILRFFE